MGKTELCPVLGYYEEGCYAHSCTSLIVGVGMYSGEMETLRAELPGDRIYACLTL